MHLSTESVAGLLLQAGNWLAGPGSAASPNPSPGRQCPHSTWRGSGLKRGWLGQEQPRGWALTRPWGRLPGWVTVDSGRPRSAGRGPSWTLLARSSGRYCRRPAQALAFCPPETRGSPGPGTSQESSPEPRYHCGSPRSSALPGSLEQRGRPDSWSAAIPGSLGLRREGCGAQPRGRSLTLRDPRAVPGAGHWGEQRTAWGVMRSPDGPCFSCAQQSEGNLWMGCFHSFLRGRAEDVDMLHSSYAWFTQLFQRVLRGRPQGCCPLGEVHVRLNGRAEPLGPRHPPPCDIKPQVREGSWQGQHL